MGNIQGSVGYSTDLLYKLLGYENEKSTKSSSVSIPKPDFTQFACCTKLTPEMSEEEYKKAIIELAKKDAAAGKFGGEYSKAYRDLKKSFVSVVSPDRKNTISEALRNILANGKVSYAEFKDGAGNIVAQYSTNSGWTMVATPSEIARESEFDTIYNEAWKTASNVETIETGSSFSMYA